MVKHVLITGGAGFIGSHLGDDLLRHGYRVRLLDNLDPQVHGPERAPPAYLDPDLELVVGDVCDAQALTQALEGVDAVVHLAARVGVGQSMYRIAEYTQTNMQGTAVLLEALLRQPVERLLLASSMSIYGEGLHRTAQGQAVDAERSDAQLAAGDWAVRGPGGEPLKPVPTPEDKRPSLASVYALTKYQQERLGMIVGRAYAIPTTGLRFFNTYGERQALSNPYTGVLAIFASRLLNDRPPLVFEDGEQRRDFVHVDDVVRACRLALETPQAAGEVFNIGSGNDVSIRTLAERMAALLGKDIAPEITDRYRKGDIRNCFADISRAQSLLGFAPQVELADGLPRLAQWLADQPAHDRVDQASRELTARGLAV